MDLKSIDFGDVLNGMAIVATGIFIVGILYLANVEINEKNSLSIEDDKEKVEYIINSIVDENHR